MDVIGWRDFVKYPTLIPMMDPTLRDLLDTMQELIPVVWDRDRVGTFLSWRKKALDTGIITRNEYNKIGHEMIHGCGGM